MGKDLGYGVILRGEVLENRDVHDDKLMFFQRPKECGGGFWLVRTYRYCFTFEIPWPVSLRQGIAHINSLNPAIFAHRYSNGRNEDFALTSPPSGEQA